MFDPESGDLQREGVRVRLQEQPARVLRELLSRAGSVVTREQLAALLWPKGVVDFDTSLNTVIRKLRSALGEVADTPKYLETLPRRGYRFIGALESDSGAVFEAPPAPDLRSDAAVRAPGSSTAPPDTPASGRNDILAPAPWENSGPTRVAICVLPFTNLSGDAGQQALTDGICEDVITELTRWRLLEVRSRSASLKYRGADIDFARVARELNVRFVVEGSVRRMADRVRIAVRLVDANGGHQVWGDRYDCPEGEFFAVQDEVVRKIVSTLVGRVQVTDAERARRKHPASLEAYECVLKGNALAWDDPVGLAEATRLFEMAIEIDPGYGAAHALLANARRREWKNSADDSSATLDQAYRLAVRSVELDNSESTCHSVLAEICLERRAFEVSLQHMRRALELNPNNQWNAANMALLLGYQGQAEEALTWSARARQIDPYFDPSWYSRQLGRAYMVLGRYREALTTYEHIPLRNFSDAAHMAGCYAQLGEMERAKSLAAECLNKLPAFSVRKMMAKEPFKLAQHAKQIEESLLLAGLPQ